MTKRDNKAVPPPHINHGVVADYIDGLLDDGMGHPQTPGTGYHAAASRAPLTLQCFQIADLHLALPKEQVLAAVDPLHVRPVAPGSPSWQMGICGFQGATLVVVDIRPLIIPAATLRRNSPDRATLRAGLIMASPNIVLACHGLDGERTVGREQVSWNHAPARYPWLLGMLATERIAMLDAAALYDCLRQL